MKINNYEFISCILVGILVGFYLTILLISPIVFTNILENNEYYEISDKVFYIQKIEKKELSEIYGQ